MPQSPIPIAEFEASFADPAEPLFLPPVAYTSPEFYEFERGAIWRQEWIVVGRLEEIPNPGDYFSIEVDREPLLIVRADDGSVNAMSAVCRHRGMFVAEGRGHCERSFVCPYHEWAYDKTGKLIGAPQAISMLRKGASLPQLRTEIWHAFIFVSFNQDAEPLAPRLAAIEDVVAPYRLEDLHGEFLTDPNYHFEFDYDINWKVYADGQNECYHCDKLHGDVPLMQNTACAQMSFGVQDQENGVFHYILPGKDIDVTLNQFGKSFWGPIEGLTEAQRWETQGVIIAPNMAMFMMPDSVITLMYYATGPTSMRVKRHRLYERSTLERPDFQERHAEENVATRYFVHQDDVAFARVQQGMESQFAPRGPIIAKELILVGFAQWLVERYRAAEGESAPVVTAF
ncbi:aromatic ring-hydroxylating dioxygenase subunit alpha [Nocardioides endophyticus]|uniref:Aromatic ring-hydroxylating dioxygenase subunit alpha n=1 Tax=Nocardioides endophyticus TaxID=1353775 RepID=A0ABP8YVB4_9ACTN